MAKTPSRKKLKKRSKKLLEGLTELVGQLTSKKDKRKSRNKDKKTSKKKLREPGFSRGVPALFADEFWRNAAPSVTRRPVAIFACLPRK